MANRATDKVRAGGAAEGRRPPRPTRRPATRLFKGAAAAGAAAAAYMTFEAQWVQCRETDLTVPHLPPGLRGLTVLHLSDIHAGLFPTNEWALRKVVDWARARRPDLVVLSGDILAVPERCHGCLDLLSKLQPRLGSFAVNGNHEYGLGKGPFMRPRRTEDLWGRAGITLLRDEWFEVNAGGPAALTLAGADYLSGGFGLIDPAIPPRIPAGFPMLLIHEPPPSASPLARCFALAFAGHTHGGQMRVPGRRGLVPLNAQRDVHLGGVYDWGEGLLVVSRGIGASSLPFRLLTRPEATLWRLV